MSLRLTPEQFDELRARGLKATAMPKHLKAATRVAKARVAVERNLQPKALGMTFALGTNKAFVPKADPRDEAMHKIQVDPKKVMALDLSMSKTGLAWGRAGELPDGTICLVAGKHHPRGTEAQELYSWAKSLSFEVLNKGCGLVIFTEFFSARGGRTTRILHSLRGAVMAEMARIGVPVIALAEISTRKAAGVDITKRRPDETKGHMKVRVRARLEQLGLGHLQEDEGDAALLLYGAKQILEGTKR